MEEEEPNNSISLIKITFIMLVLIAVVYLLTREYDSLLPEEPTQTIKEVFAEPLKIFPEDAALFEDIPQPPINQGDTLDSLFQTEEQPTSDTILLDDETITEILEAERARVVPPDTITE